MAGLAVDETKMSELEVRVKSLEAKMDSARVFKGMEKVVADGLVAPILSGYVCSLF